MNFKLRLCAKQPLSCYFERPTFALVSGACCSDAILNVLPIQAQSSNNYSHTAKGDKRGNK
eukprot:4170482-Amphidinium_carterae.1